MCLFTFIVRIIAQKSISKVQGAASGDTTVKSYHVDLDSPIESGNDKQQTAFDRFVVLLCDYYLSNRSVSVCLEPAEVYARTQI